MLLSEPPPTTEMPEIVPSGAVRPVLVWDLPVRIGHWLMAAGFALAWLTAESERLHAVHEIAGQVVLAVALFRIAWGFVGSRHARFAAFVRGPAAVGRHLAGMLAGRPAHHAGHNPAGGWAVVGLLGLALATALAGWALEEELAGRWLEDAHEALASGMLALVGLHLAGVAAGSLLHRENLVRAMLGGTKRGAPDEALRSARPLAGLVLIAWMAAFVWFAG